MICKQLEMREVQIKQLVFIKDFIRVHFPGVKIIKLVCALILLSGCLIFYVFLNLPDGRLHLFFFNVGQGESIFIQTPTNQRILIDGGPDERVLTRLGKVLPFYDKTLDLIVLTHPHADHVTGLIEVINRYKTNLTLANRTDYQTPELDKFWKITEKRGVAVRGLTMGERIELGDIRLDCFWPPKGRVETDSGDPNLDSIVLRLKFGNFSVLLTGDAEKVVQEQLVLLEKIPPRTNVLKIPHQGAKECCDEEFIKKLDPKLTVISVGKNHFGHPDKNTLELFDNLGIKVLRTDQEGTIEVVSDGKNWWVQNGR